MRTVTIDDPPRMNLLGLILGNILERNLERPELSRRATRIAAEVVVKAGEMAVTLGFRGGDGVVIRRGAAERPRAAVAGSLQALTDLALGGGMVGAVLRRRLRPRGSLLLLLRLRRLLQV